MKKLILSIIFLILGFLERLFSYLKGKGYGSTSVAQEVRQLKSLLIKKPMLAIDVGGNKGTYSAELRKIYPDLEIHIFEPSKTNLKILQDKFGDDPQVVIVPFALSEHEGAGKLYSDYFGSGMASLVKRRMDHFNTNLNNTEEVRIIKFEDYWKTVLKKRNIDILKLDIEGYELNALNGMGDAIKFTHAIQFEFGGCNIDTKTYFQDFWYFFQNVKFRIYRITPIGLEYLKKYKESDEFFITTNFIAIQKYEKL